MSQSGDNIVLYLLLAMFFFFLFRHWFRSPIQRFQQKSAEKTSLGGEVPRLLRDQGYTVIQSKQKVPLTFEIDESDYESRVYVDYIAKEANECYLVVVARERKPLRLNGPGIRDFFLPLFLLYEPDGILYVNKEKGQIKKITINVPDCKIKKKSETFPLILIGMILGIVLSWLLRS